VPLSFGWLDPGDPPYAELPMRVQRAAYREFSRNPDFSFERYKEILGRELFGAASTPQAVDDVLELQAALNSHIYTVHGIEGLLPGVILDRARAASQHGVRWYFSRPPIVGIEYEMDLRGVRTELRIV
jgi:hypothetical protein